MSVTPSGGVKRVGIAGAGWVTQYHLPAWAAHPGRATVVAIADPDEGARLRRAAAFGIAGVHGAAEAMIATEPLDIIDICTPVEAHAPLVRLAADRGIAVICQKPLARDLGEARVLIAGLDPAARVMVHDNWRFRATYRRIWELLEAGVAGQIRRVQLDYVSSGMIPDATGARPALVRQPNFRSMDRLLVMEVMIHHLDTLRFLLGDLDLVTATMARSNDEIVGEDIATLTLYSDRHRAPVLVAGNLAVHGEQQQARDQVRIYGSRATIVLDGYRLTVTGETNLIEDFDPVATYEGAYRAAIGHFLDGLETGAPFETAPADNLKTLALVDAAYAAAKVHGGT
jgi:predicted dehydrogenase